MLSGACTSEKKRQKLKDKLQKKGAIGEGEGSLEFADSFIDSMANLNPKTITREFYSDYITPLDDNIDIDALQNKLQEQMQNNGIVYNPAEGKKNVADEEKTSSQKENKKEVKKEISALKKRLLEKRENYKKYVIYVSEENVEYIDSLSIQDRKKIINDILHDRDVIAKRTRRFKENAKFTNQILIMIFMK